MDTPPVSIHNISVPSVDETTQSASLTTSATASISMAGDNTQPYPFSDATAMIVNAARTDMSTTGLDLTIPQGTTCVSTTTWPARSLVEPCISIRSNIMSTSCSPPYYTPAHIAYDGAFPNTIPFSIIPNMASTQFGYPYASPSYEPGFMYGSVNSTATSVQQPTTSRWCPDIRHISSSSYYRPYNLSNHMFSTSSIAQPAQNMWRPSTLMHQTDYAADLTLSQSQISSRQVIPKDLPSFSGHPEEWPLFITNFEQSTDRCGFSNQENLIRLQRSLKGPALEAVRGKLMMPSTVPLAIATLRMLFGRPDVIHDALQRKLRQTPSVRMDRLETLINLALGVQNYRATIHAIGLSNYINDPILLNDLVNKLPGDMKLDWGRRRIEAHHVDIGVFDDWLFNIATCASLVTPVSTNIVERAEEKSNRTGQKERVFVHESDAVDDDRLILCIICNNTHQLQNCPSFISMNRKDRWNFVKEKRLCIRCFKNHMVRRCNSRKQCGVDGCTMAHNPLLHSITYYNNSSDNNNQNLEPDNNNSNSTQNTNNTVLFHSRKRSMLFRCIPVILHGNGVSIKTLALIDEGSSLSLIDTQLANQLCLDGPKKDLCMKWTGDITQIEEDSKSVNLSISSQLNNSKVYKLFNVRTIGNMDLPEQSLDIAVVQYRPHLKSLPVQFYDKSKPRILIGLDNVKLITALESREGDNDGLIATRCRLGWSVYGREYLDKMKYERLMHICDCNRTNELDEMMRHFFSLESIGISPNVKPLVSKDDERALTIMKTTSKFLESEKRWETGLLWKYKTIHLPDSLPMARKRLECLVRKMLKDDKLRIFVNNKIKEYLEKGYIKKMSADDVCLSGRSWYLPIFVVNNVNKNKMRIVWDAAAKVNDISLNTVLLKGPDLLRSLIGILIRFRERKIAICGDIREMFHQVRIIESDQMFQRFLWRDGDVSREPDIYIMKVMTFGASCSPSLANYIKDKNADRFVTMYPQAVNSIKKNTFVDDWLQSVDSEVEMRQLSNTVRRIHSEGGFEMRNWISNSKLVLESLNKNSNPTTKFIDDHESKHEKILGLWWLPDSDKLTFRHKFANIDMDGKVAPSKRQLLRILMMIFDPMGLLGFFIVEAKIILQDVWRSGVSWDDPIQETEKNAWLRWISKLNNISKIHLPRCYNPSIRDDNAELHIFVDASIQAYAAVAYFRSRAEDVFVTSIVLSKTRVAPLKPISVPRMELMAAVLGLRMARFIQSEASINIKRRVFWTDSKDVLYWIRSDARKFHQFVAVRIGEILQDSSICEWRWVPTKDNAADDGTKINNNDDIHENYRWFNGPKFLSLAENEWPINDIENYVQLINEPSSTLAAPITKDNWQSSPDIKGFSKWEKLRMAQMYVLRFFTQLVKRPYNNSELCNIFHLSPIISAELILIKNCQKDVFFEELDQLQSQIKMVSRKSPIYKFSPYLDEFGVLRVRGRIDAATSISFDVKRPIILPRNHHITWLIVDFYHRKFHHHHNEIVVNEIRQRYCITGMRALVRQICKNCQKCKNQRVIPSPPEMGNLPAERITAFTRPFTFTGIDYFGPIEVVVGRRREKRWAVLFTCMTVRAVHIELTPSLTTDSFLLVLKQFISRRGVPRRIFSDNATNFRGASRILVDEIEKVSYNKLEHDYPEIDWKFIPPASPHMGGTWERMIRSAKSILFDILPRNILREEVLRAALADVENILNMRPLTYVPLETTESEALTPNHFLLGTSSGVREKGDLDDCGTSLSRNFRIAGQVADSFWRRWVRECLPCLTRRTKWHETSDQPISVGDVVIIVDENSKRNTWTKARVIDVVQAKDGKIRSAVVKTSSGISTRPAVKLARLDLVNSTSKDKVYGGENVKV